MLSSTNSIHSLNEILPNLFISSENTAYNKQILQTSRITSIITLTGYAPFEDEPIYTYLKLECEDDIDTNILPLVSTANHFITKQLAASQKVLVHCSAGVSRSGSIIIGYLIHLYKCSYLDALAIAQKGRSFIQPNPGFAIQLNALAYKLSSQLASESKPVSIITLQPGLTLTTIDYYLYQRCNQTINTDTPVYLITTTTYDRSIIQMVQSNLQRQIPLVYNITVRSSQLISIIDTHDVNWEQVFTAPALIIGTTPDMITNIRTHYLAFTNSETNVARDTTLIQNNSFQNTLAINYYLSNYEQLPSIQIDNLLYDLEIQSIDMMVGTNIIKPFQKNMLLNKLYDIYCITEAQRNKKKKLIGLLE